MASNVGRTVTRNTGKDKNMSTDRKQRVATKALREPTVLERLFQYETTGSLTTLALFGYATDPDLADRAVELALDYQQRQTGRRVGKRERSRYRAELIRGTQRRFKPDDLHREPAIIRAIAYALDLEVALGFKEPKPEPTDPAVMILAEPATQTIQ